MELTVRADRAPGALGRVLAAVAEQGVNIIAYSAYHDLEGAFVSLITEEVMKARQTLEVHGFKCTTSPVILVGAADRVGAVASICEDLQRAGIDISYSYASYAGGGRFYAVFKTDDDERALQALSVGELARASQLRQATNAVFHR
jgi:hypothetical protein